MDKFFKKINLVLPISILGVIWCILVLTLADFEKTKFLFWAGFAFGLLTFIITGAVTYYIHRKTTNTTIELSMPVYFSTSLYFIVSILLNTIFVIISNSDSKKLGIIPNVVIILLYAAVMIFALKNTQRVKELGNKITTKVVSVQMIAVQIGSIIDQTEDADIKEQLKKLKEYVDFSDQIGIDATKETEDRFRTQIFDIQTMIDEGEPTEEVLKKIKSATSTWKTRNSMLATLR